jgi:hypothetical protein
MSKEGEEFRRARLVVNGRNNIYEGQIDKR